MKRYLRVCGALAKAKVRYVMVGAFGINLLSGPRGPVLATEDCDLFLPARSEQLARAVTTLLRLGFSIEAGDEPLVGGDPVVLAGIVRARACVRAVKGSMRIDLPLEIAGFDHAALWRRRRLVKIKGVTVRIAPIDALLTSKRLANRPKDRAFLEMYFDEIRRRKA